MMVGQYQTGALESKGLFYGIYSGVVWDNRDATKSGRLRICVPQIDGENKSSIMYKPLGLYVGQNTIASIPAVDEEVYVAFLNGDTSFGVWIQKTSQGALADLYDEDGVPRTGEVRVNAHNLLLRAEEELHLSGGAVSVEATGDGRIGISNEHQNLRTSLSALLDGLSAFFDALNMAVPVPNDGGAMIKTAIQASLTSLTGTTGNQSLSQIKQELEELLSE